MSAARLTSPSASSEESGSEQYWGEKGVRLAQKMHVGCTLARAFLWEYSYKMLKLAQLLGQLGVFLTWPR